MWHFPGTPSLSLADVVTITDLERDLVGRFYKIQDVDCHQSLTTFRHLVENPESQLGVLKTPS